MIIDADRLEKIIIALIFLTLSVTFIFKPGDKVEVEITDIGVLSNTIKDEII